MTKQSKRLVVLWLLVLLLAVGAFYYFVIFDLQQSNQTLEDDLAFEERREAAFRDSIENEEQQDVTDVEQLRDALPETLAEDDVVQLLNDASNTTSTTVQTINFTEEATMPASEHFASMDSDENLHVLTMELSGESGSYRLFEQFIDRIERDPRLAEISGLQFQQSEASVTFQLTMSVFAYPMNN
ncbi:Tfp pilus assembly protein PilO [Alkalibacillus flavidus]|uniref:Tfp pilus assembly protein PilO n=1 Tax=Alkalibacillus flavidus TaxID=546021 RepID=A0ABV2KU55_9BACI